MIVLIPVLLMLAPVALVVFVVWLGRDVLVRKHRHPIEMRLVHMKRYPQVVPWKHGD